MAIAANPDRPDIGSDLQHAGDDTEPAPKKASRQILKHEIEEGLDALGKPVHGLFVSGLCAGLDLGFSLFLMAVLRTRAEGVLPAPVVDMLGANMYTVGFIFVVLGRSELFTEQTTLAVLPVLRGRATIGSLLRLWGVVYVANLLGAAAFAWLTVLVGPALGVIEPRALGTIAHRLTDHPASTVLLSAVLAGWLMGLVSWLVAAGRDSISQVVLVWLVTAAIGFAGLHHVILGTVEVLAGAFAGQGVGALEFGRFLVWASLGNILGGVFFVAFLKYGHARPEAQAA